MATISVLPSRAKTMEPQGSNRTAHSGDLYSSLWPRGGRPCPRPTDVGAARRDANDFDAEFAHLRLALLRSDADSVIAMFTSVSDLLERDRRNFLDAIRSSAPSRGESNLGDVVRRRSRDLAGIGQRLVRILAGRYGTLDPRTSGVRSITLRILNEATKCELAMLAIAADALCVETDGVRDR